MPFKKPRPEKRNSQVASNRSKEGNNAKSFYSKIQSANYTTMSNAEKQSDMTKHALRMLGDKPIDFVLDIGCGSGLSLKSAVKELGTFAIGFDTSEEMLKLSYQHGVPESKADVYLACASQKFPFRSGLFDAAISISMLQWLCYGDPGIAFNRLILFFKCLFGCLTKDARCAFQVYPDGIEHSIMLLRAATQSHFYAELVVDYPHSDASKKWFLYLDKDLTNSKTESIQCPIGRRLNLSCALSLWTRMNNPGDYSEYCITRLYTEHVQSAFHVLRKVRRARKYESIENEKLHPKAQKSLHLSNYELLLEKTISDQISSKADLSVLQENAEKVVAIMHNACKLSTEVRI